MIPIVFSTDHNYVMQTGVTILSLLESAQDTQYDIFIIISRNVTDNDKQLLQSQVGKYDGHRLSFIPAPDHFNSSYEIRGITTAAYYRLMIPWLIPNYDKIIYSDVDIIFRTSLQEVFDTDMSDNHFGGVSVTKIIEPTRKRYFKSIPVSINEYINSGFLIINSAQLRKEDVKGRFIEEAQKKYIFQDQDIINIVSRGRIKLLPPRYNVLPLLYELHQAGNPALNDFYGSAEAVREHLEGRNCVIHYAGNKPWKIVSFAWLEWWNTYHRSVFYNPDYEIDFLFRLRNPKYSWSDLLQLIRKKLLH